MHMTIFFSKNMKIRKVLGTETLKIDKFLLGWLIGSILLSLVVGPFIFFSDIIEIGNKNVLASKIRIAATWDELNNSVPSKACIPRFIRMKELPQINPRSKR